MSFEALKTPGKIGGLTIKNRIVVPAINNNYTHRAQMTERSVDCYVSKAKGGAGLVIVEATSVDYPQSRSVMNPALDRDEYMPAFTRIAEGCHAYGAKTFVQLTHVGRQTKKSASGLLPVAPSPIAGNSPLYPDQPRVLEKDEITFIIRKFAEAAQRAKACGFDGVEIHMGHGYLVNNFLTPLSNHRTDEYGGLKGGILFASQIVEEVKKACGKDFLVSCRINGDDFVPKEGNSIIEYQLVAQRLEAAGADVLNITGGMRDSELNFNDHCCGTPHAAWLSLAERIKRCVNIPVISVKRYTPEEAEKAVKNGAVDFIAFGKQSIADPSFASKILTDRVEDMLPCISCSQGCYDRLWMWKPITCAFNPEAGMTFREIENHNTLKGSSRILVVGAGPAGCTLSLELAKMGHKVKLIDRRGQIGGHYRFAALTERKSEINNWLAYMEKRLSQQGVELLLNTSLEELAAKQNTYDIAVDASGIGFAAPSITDTQPGLPYVCTPLQALTGKEKLGKYVVIAACSFGCPWTCRPIHNEIPDDWTGCKTNESHACILGFAAADTAEELANCGMKVEILAERNSFMPGLGFTNRNYMNKRFFTNNISVSGGVHIDGLIPGGLLCSKEGLSFKVAADSVVFSNKLSRTPLEPKLKTIALKVYAVGDIQTPGNMMEAIHNAYRLAETITQEAAKEN